MKRTKRDLMKFILLDFTFYLILSLFNFYLTFHFRLSIYPSNYKAIIRAASQFLYLLIKIVSDCSSSVNKLFPSLYIHIYIYI